MVLFCPNYLVLLTWHKPGLIGEEEISIEEMQPVGKFVGGRFLIDDRWERVQLTVGGATPGIVVLGGIRKQVE